MPLTGFGVNVVQGTLPAYGTQVGALRLDRLKLSQLIRSGPR